MWKLNKTKQFFGNSYTSPTPSIYTIQQLGLGITKAFSTHIRNATKSAYTTAIQSRQDHTESFSIMRKYGRTEGVTTRECVIGKGERIERRPSLGHVPVADTPILMQQSSQPGYVIMYILSLRHHHLQPIYCYNSDTPLTAD